MTEIDIDGMPSTHGYLACIRSLPLIHNNLQQIINSNALYVTLQHFYELFVC